MADRVERRPLLLELQENARLRLAARDFHAHDRILILDGGEPSTRQLAASAAKAAPRTRVTFLTERLATSERNRLHTAGVEVASEAYETEWLLERLGHYSLVIAAQHEFWFRLRSRLLETQPQASFVDAMRLESASRRAPLARLLSVLGIVGR